MDAPVKVRVHLVRDNNVGPILGKYTTHTFHFKLRI